LYRRGGERSVQTRSRERRGAARRGTHGRRAPARRRTAVPSRGGSHQTRTWPSGFQLPAPTAVLGQVQRDHDVIGQWDAVVRDPSRYRSPVPSRAHGDPSRRRCAGGHSVGAESASSLA
jgi:hypothetical protein